METMLAQTSAADTGSSPNNADAFAAQIQHLIEVAGDLHASKVAGDYERFQETCDAVGLTGPIGLLNQPAVEFYWHRMDGIRSSGGIKEAKTNTHIAAALGIGLNNKDTPRNRLLYHLFECVAPDLFRAEITDGPHVGGKQGKKLNGSRRVLMFDQRHEEADTWHMSMVSFFKGKTPADIVDQRVFQKSEPLRRALDDVTGLKLGELLFRLQMILPDARTAPLIGEVLKRGMAGEEVILTGAFCPDYGYEPTGNPALPWRYTFDTLGEGVGLVAQQFARVIPPLSRFLTGLGVRHKIVLGIGDFEADSQKILDRVGLNYEQFVTRCKRSLEAFGVLMGPDLPVTLELSDADRCKGRLRPYAREATAAMVNGNFGCMPEVFDDPDELVDQIVRDNGTFYKRWYRPDITDAEIREIVLAQGGEYAALSRIDREDFGSNVIIISGDRPMMHAFDNYHDVMPVLCVKRAY